MSPNENEERGGKNRDFPPDAVRLSAQVPASGQAIGEIWNPPPAAQARAVQAEARPRRVSVGGLAGSAENCDPQAAERLRQAPAPSTSRQTMSIGQPNGHAK
ncbi:hypothetical protein MASR2M8_04200 [Opitutaceae bacterium]